MTKWCPDCGEIKHTIYWNKNKARYDDLGSICSACQKVRFDKWRRENPEKWKATCRRWRRKNKVKQTLKKMKLRYEIKLKENNEKNLHTM